MLLVQHTVSPGLGSRRHSGGNVLPVIVTRGASCSASRVRRRASAQVIRSQSAITLCTGPTDVGRILFDQAHDEVMAGRYLLASGSFERLECVQPNPSTVVFEVHLTDLRHRCIKRIEGSGHLGRHGDTNRTHVRNASPRRPAATGAEAPTVDKGATVDNFDTL